MVIEDLSVELSESEALKVSLTDEPPSSTVIVVASVTGASLTAVNVIVTVAEPDNRAPIVLVVAISVAVIVKVSAIVSEPSCL